MNREEVKDRSVLSIKDLKNAARRNLPKSYAEFHDEGAMDLVTLQENEAAYNRYKIRPRTLVNVENIDMSSEFLGSKVALPITFGPTGMQRLAHPDGELATSRAAARKNLGMVLAMHSTVSLKEVAMQGNGNPYAIHLLMLKDRALMKDILRKAEEAGYKAVFLSVDCPTLGKRINEHRNNFIIPENLCWPNLLSRGREEFFGSNSAMQFDASIEWHTIIPWLRQTTFMQVWIKGVSTVEDVELAIQHGVDGVVISNHGGRQLDGIPATLDALRECAPVAKGRIKIAVDGGIRRGSDIFKALAMGADHCFLGRIPIWGLAYNGQSGVQLAVDILQHELRITMALAGCRSISDINRNHLSILRSDGILAKL
ncbi:FMN-dependent dehydrogenase [Aspergillus pseudocaelatus]|uniref:FMN-dependent dehydrogenase n=1 Tax=Aspergillus pseudocaelatus TaxID=1825620 RepID=A0ABQ6WFV3_9EURO|nr:FMN-dependent dehydrogenase [Aspergillus pseudocaelatus]